MVGFNYQSILLSLLNCIEYGIVWLGIYERICHLIDKNSCRHNNT